MIPFLKEFFVKQFRLGSETGPLFTSGTGSPEGAVTAPIGSTYSRTDGGTNTTEYTKESGTGNTGWVARSNAAGGGGGAQGVIVPMNFGASFTDKVSVTVTGLTWVDTTKPITAQVMTPSGSDPDEIYLLNFDLVVSNVSNGVGFKLTLYSRSKARGTYNVHCVGQ